MIERQGPSVEEAQRRLDVTTRLIEDYSEILQSYPAYCKAFDDAVSPSGRRKPKDRFIVKFVDANGAMIRVASSFGDDYRALSVTRNDGRPDEEFAGFIVRNGTADYRYKSNYVYHAGRSYGVDYEAAISNTTLTENCAVDMLARLRDGLTPSPIPKILSPGDYQI